MLHSAHTPLQTSFFTKGKKQKWYLSFIYNSGYSLQGQKVSFRKNKFHRVAVKRAVTRGVPQQWTPVAAQ